MVWPGKADCFKTIQQPSLGTLRPCPEESVNFDASENLIIEGDNLEVLKLLQKSYLGKIKMIYIEKDSKFPTRGGYLTQPLTTTSLGDRPNLRFPIIHNGKEIWVQYG